jgi:predicted ATPase
LAVSRTIAKPHPSPADAVRDELRLLRRARAAVAREEFGAALQPIAEHTHRFRDGRLAEEREALRVKSLAGLGRREEARRAAASFEARFPHSVLLPAVRQMPVSPP